MPPGSRIKQGGVFARSTIPPVLATASYNVNNQQTTFGTNTLTYDFNGNLQTVTDAGGTATYSWNARNQLAGISSTGFAASFSYDSFGRRTGKTIQGTTTNFVYDGLNPVQEKAGATVTANLLTGLGIDEFLTRTDGAGTRGLLSDALGSTVALGDGTGTVQTQYTYEPFGYATTSGAASTSSYKYTGREDDGSGLYYYRARYYHPRLQRFISEDPIGFRGGDSNLYGYVGGNPLSWRDPLGQFTLVLPLVPPLIDAAGGIIAGGIAGQIIADIINIYRKPPAGADDPDGAKAPGKPTADDGFVQPKGGDDWVRAPNGQWGWKDKSGDIWCPTGKSPGKAHGDPHWDVQPANKRRPFRNVYPGGGTRP